MPSVPAHPEIVAPATADPEIKVLHQPEVEAIPVTSMTTSTAVATIEGAFVVTPAGVVKTETAASLAEGTTDSVICATAEVTWNKQVLEPVLSRFLAGLTGFKQLSRFIK
jgi:hypothetical protein